MDQEYKFWLVVLLTLILAIAIGGTACDIRDRQERLQMAEKGYCWDRSTNSEMYTYRPCAKKE